MSLSERTAKQRAANERAKLIREARSITIRNKRIPSQTEREAKYFPPGHGLFFCPHEKHYFTECKTCKRSFARGQENMRSFLSKTPA